MAPAKPVAFILLSVTILLALLICYHREFDSSDEGYLFYDAWAALGPAPEGTLPSRAWFKSTAYLTGIPFLFDAQATVLDLRLYSLVVWLAAYYGWFLVLTRFWNTSRQWAVCLLPLSLFSLQFPLISYQTMPAVFGMLSAACLLISWGTDRARLLFLTGFIFGGTLLGMAFAYTACVSLSILSSILACCWLRKPGFRPGMLAGLLVGSLLWYFVLPIELIARDQSFAGQELAFFGGLSGILESRGPRFVRIILTMVFLLAAGEVTTRVLQKFQPRVRESLFGSRALSMAVMMLAMVFVFMWILEWRRQTTLIGYLAFAFIFALPLVRHIWLHQKQTMELFIMMNLLLLVPSMMVGGFGTNSFIYYLGYAGPALSAWVLLPALASRHFLPDSLRILPWRTCWMAMVGISILITLTLGNRMGSLMETRIKWTGPGLFNGLYFTETNKRSMEELMDMEPLIRGGQVIVHDYTPIAYVLWNRSCPFDWTWRFPDTPHDRVWLADPTNRPISLLFRTHEQVSAFGRNHRLWLDQFPFTGDEKSRAEVHATDSDVFTLIRIP